MNISNVLELCGIFSGLGGILACMVCYQLSIYYAQKNSIDLSQKIHGTKNNFGRKLSDSESLQLTSIACAIFINYHFRYKRKKNMKINKNMYSQLTEKNVLFIVNNHYRWIILNVLALFFGLSWMVFSTLFFFLAKQF